MRSAMIGSVRRWSNARLFTVAIGAGLAGRSEAPARPRGERHLQD